MGIQRVDEHDPAVVDTLLKGETPRLIFKHSPTCGYSSMAFTEVSVFADAHPELPVFLVDVIAQRPLARQLAATLGIRHESPQAILVADSVPLWNASHGGVTVREIESAFARASR